MSSLSLSLLSLELFLVVLFVIHFAAWDYVWDVFLCKILIQSSISDTWWFWDVGSKTRLPAVKARKWKLEVCIPIIIKATMQIYLMNEQALSSFLRVVSGDLVWIHFVAWITHDIFLWEILIQSSISNTWWFWDAGSDFPCPTWKQEVKSRRCVYPSSWVNN